MPGRSASAYRVLASSSRIMILHALQQADHALTLREIAQVVDLRESTAREHLDRLIGGRFARKTAEVRPTRGRPHMLYESIDREALADADSRFRSSLITILLAGYGHLMASPAEASARAGEEAVASWPARSPVTSTGHGAGPAASGGERDPALRQLAELEAHLDDLRFEPQIDPDGRRIHLHRCPFLDLARTNPDVVCSVHLCLVRGVLARSGGPLVAERLDPFVGPEHCILHFAPRFERGGRSPAGLRDTPLTRPSARQASIGMVHPRSVDDDAVVAHLEDR